jgi:ubiquitin carboxyl-terminal hydrolase 5/13
MSQPEETKNAFENLNPNAGVFSLQSFVTHLGTSIHSGHFVAHIKKEGKWIYYNDCKVAITTEPPIGKGYVYFLTKP